MKKTLLIALTAGLLVSSCAYYKPQAVDIPLISHQGDCRIDGALSVSTLVIIPNTVGSHLTATYGFTDHLAGQVYISGEGFNGGMGHLALGGYLPYEKFVLEGYLGAGIGYSPSATNADQPPAVVEDSEPAKLSITPLGGHFSTYFMQVNAGWVGLAKGHIDLGFGLKRGWINPDFATREWHYNSSTEQYSPSTTTYTHGAPITEPQFMFRVGGQKLKFTIKLGFLIAPRAEFPHDQMTLSLGANYRF